MYTNRDHDQALMHCVVPNAIQCCVHTMGKISISVTSGHPGLDAHFDLKAKLAQELTYLDFDTHATLPPSVHVYIRFTLGNHFADDGTFVDSQVRKYELQ